jgi:hypothetical protein
MQDGEQRLVVGRAVDAGEFLGSRLVAAGTESRQHEDFAKPSITVPRPRRAERG